MATQTQPQPAAQVSGKLSDQNLLIRRDVYEALPAFYRCCISTPQGLHFGNGGCGYGTKYGLDIATETEPRSGFIGRILDWLQGIGVRSEIDRRREEAYRDVFLFLAYAGVKEVGV